MYPTETAPELEAILDYLKYYRSCDLTGYKRSSLMRRFRHRMQSLDIDSYPSYLQYLQSHAQEYQHLLDDVFINFTSFFRDRDTWNYLATEIIPQILASKQPDEPIRVWSAGCAAGQEVYSLVMLLAEALGIDDYLQRVQIFATDIDEAAVQQARLGLYSAQEITGIPPDWLAKYFEKTEQGYVFHRELRKKIVFGHHNLAEDAPMSKIDLLTCRNVFIYFNGEVQKAVLVRFHFALKDNGFLVLGNAESLTHNRAIFTPVNLNCRVYAKGLELELADRLRITPKLSKKSTPEPPTPEVWIWQTAFESSALAQIVINLNGCLLMTNERANRLFGLSLDDRGRSIQELEPGKLIDFSALRQVYNEQHPVTLKKLAWATPTGTQYFDMALTPVFRPHSTLVAVHVVFWDSNHPHSDA